MGAALWRGGAPIGMVLHETFRRAHHVVDHISPRTTRFTAPGQAKAVVEVHGIDYLVGQLQANSRLLIVEDVVESGLSVEALILALKERLGAHMPKEVRVAALYDKPSHRKTGPVTDYYVHQSEAWIVFPHELEGLTGQDVFDHWGEEAAGLLACCGNNPGEECDMGDDYICHKCGYKMAD